MHISAVRRLAIGTEERFAVAGVTCEVDGRTLPVINLSAGGFFAAGEAVPSPGSIVTIRINLPDGVVISGLGKVAWVNLADGRGHPRLPAGCGIQNYKISFSDKVAIVAALQRFELPLARRAQGGRIEHHALKGPAIPANARA